MPTNISNEIIQLLLHSKVAKAESYLIGSHHNEWLELTYYIETLTAKISAKESTTRKNIESTTLEVGSTITQMEFSTITTVKTTSTKDYDEDYEHNLNCSDYFDMGFR